MTFQLRDIVLFIALLIVIYLHIDFDRYINRVTTSSLPDEQEYNFNFDYRTIWNRYVSRDNFLKQSKDSSSQLFENNTKLTLPLPYISPDLFQRLADIVILERDTFSGQITDDGCVVFVQSGALLRFATQMARINVKARKYILISHRSDWKVPRGGDAALLNDSNLLAWFTENVAVTHPKLIGVPIGAPSYVYPKFNVTILRKQSRILVPLHRRRTLIYVNFKIENNPRERQLVFQSICGGRFGNRSDIDCSTRTTQNYTAYLNKLGDSKFVISPSGHGMDCYRTWEALIMGAVPIVANNSLWPLYVDMPVMVINDWNKDVSIDSLIDFENRINQEVGRKRLTIAERPKIWAKYWIDKINKYRFNLLNNRSFS